MAAHFGCRLQSPAVVGELDGAPVGASLGVAVLGAWLGALLGTSVGACASVGAAVTPVGAPVGRTDGRAVGTPDGRAVVGIIEGAAELSQHAKYVQPSAPGQHWRPIGKPNAAQRACTLQSPEEEGEVVGLAVGPRVVP